MATNLDSDPWRKAKRPLARYLKDVGVSEPLTPKADFDLWEMYSSLLDYAQEVPCETLGRFVLFAASTGTYAIEVASLDTSKGRATVNCYGPIADDANDYDSAGYKQKAIRLRASYRLTKEEIHDPLIGLSSEEKGMLLRAIREKSKTGLQMFSSAFNLRET